MNHRRFLELFREFARHIEALHTLYLDSLVGYSILNDRLHGHQESIRKLLGEHEYATGEFQDTCPMLYKDLSNRDFTPVSMSPVMKQGDMKRRLVDDGQNTQLLGRQCVVSAYAYWEEYLRIEVGKAMGVLSASARASEETRRVLNKHVVSNFWGDMRHIRNSIVHSNGVANAEVSKCKILTWFKPGDPIELPHARMRSIFLCMGRYRNELHDLSLPKRAFRIPKGRNDG
jgi:hypothetical protein